MAEIQKLLEGKDERRERRHVSREVKRLMSCVQIESELASFINIKLRNSQGGLSDLSFSLPWDSIYMYIHMVHVIMVIIF